MADANDRLNIQLIDAGDHKDRVVMVLSKIKGLTMTPQQVIQKTPCTVATGVPRNIAEQLREYLERAGAMVMLEGGQDVEEDELFPPDKFSLTDEKGAEASGRPSEDEDVLDFEPLREPPAQPEDDVLSEGSAMMFTTNDKLEAFEDAVQESSESHPQPDSETAPLLPEEPTDSSEAVKKMPDLFSSPVVFALVGALAGGLIMGVWGWTGIQKQRQERLEYESLTAQQIEDHSAQLKGMVAEFSQQVEILQQQNKELETQNLALIHQAESAKKSGQIVPTGRPMERSSWEAELVRSFQAVVQRHTKILENGSAAQKEAGCSQQVLLDGKSTLAYAQVVKNFSAQHIRYDVRRSDSLVTPYIAEFKIPFQQESKSGAMQAACQSAALQPEDTPPHHEFGGYYGYLTLEYLYREHAWVLNTTVSERNRALYDHAFRNGSPEFAKFTIDTAIFPELAVPHSQ